MSRGVNKVILIGNVGADPIPRTTPTGIAVVNLKLATTESWRDKVTREPQTRTEWHSLVFFAALANIVLQNVTKGAQLYIEGSLRTRKWYDKNGIERYITEIVVDTLRLLDSRVGRFNKTDAAGSEQNSEVSNPVQANPAEMVETAQTEVFIDDDIPF